LNCAQNKVSFVFCVFEILFVNSLTIYLN